MPDDVRLPPRLPDDSQRHAIVGRTGSGKTQFGMWSLSERSFDSRPWTVFDYKGDAFISQLPAKEIGINEKPPTAPGLYVVRPLPEADDENVERFLWRVWERGNAGLYFDEGYMVPQKKGAMNGILTQGRSKSIPVIMLSQRPLWLTRFVWSESDFFSLFNLNDRDDRLTVKRYVNGVEADYRLPSYFSYYYDVGRDQLDLFRPVPEQNVIMATFERRAPKKVRHL